MKQITMICHGFVQEQNNFAFSGGDRYVIDLAYLVKDLGFEPIIYQQSQQHFQTEFFGLKVIGFPAENQPLANLAMTEYTHRSALTIFHNPLMAHPRVPKKSIALSHGITFDHPRLQPVHDSDFDNFRNEIMKCIGNVELLVSVDANSLNVFNALFAGRLSHKFRHIPNYADIDKYTPKEKKSDTIKFIYPRRIEIIRGIKEWQNAVEDLENYQNVEFHTCGTANMPENIQFMNRWIEQNPNRKFYSKTFDEMPEAYQNCNVAVIPTIGCEGTSFSAIEAMACGLPVISTYVGGLSQLVIDGYNGIVVNPFYEDIREAMRYFIENPNEIKRMGDNARKVAEQMSKEKWKDKWKKVIDEVI